MLVGKRKYFEDEPNDAINPTFALRRKITQEKNLETLSQARKRITLQNLSIIQEKYPQIHQSDIIRLLEDFDNNIEMVFEMLAPKNNIPQNIDFKDADFNNFKRQIMEELLKRLQQSQDLQTAQQIIKLCFDAFEGKLGEKYQSNSLKIQDENKLLKSAFLKQDKRMEQVKIEAEKIRIEAENKDKQNLQIIKQLTEENKQQQLINNQLTVLLIQAQQANNVSINSNINNDIY